MLIFKHDAVLAFVGRLLRDREFCEWFAMEPRHALSSHGLDRRDLADVFEVLRTDRRQPEMAAAMEPLVETMLQLVEESDLPAPTRTPSDRLDTLDASLRETRERVAEARTKHSRPWWKFWA